MWKTEIPVKVNKIGDFAAFGFNWREGGKLSAVGYRWLESRPQNDLLESEHFEVFSVIQSKKPAALILVSSILTQHAIPR
jgi:hypothetical protein